MQHKKLDSALSQIKQGGFHIDSGETDKYESFDRMTLLAKNYRRSDELMFNLVQKLNPDNYQDGATLAELTQSVSDGVDAAEKRMEDRAWQNRFGKELRVAGWTLKLKRRDKKPTRLWFPSIKT